MSSSAEPRDDGPVDATAGRDARRRVVPTRPQLEVPAVVPLDDPILARSTETVLAITHLLVYQTGITFTFIVHLRGDLAEFDPDLHHVFYPGRLRARGSAAPDNAVWLGIQTANGARATNRRLLRRTQCNEPR